MTNPTNPFSWQMPTATDLVTDLPADFEVFGQAVATSMADLLGGTTGQVLSKASNTNMDFTWVTSDDANAIQNAIVDAKGDLIAASANDTPARLAVGANDLLVTAASGEATGLKYTGGWTTYTPTVTNLTVGNGTLNARYCKIGKLVTVYLGFTMGSTSVMGAAPSLTLPINAATNNVDFQFVGNILDSGTQLYNGIIQVNNSIAYPNVAIAFLTYVQPSSVLSTAPMTWTTNDGFQFVFSYEVA